MILVTAIDCSVLGRCLTLCVRPWIKLTFEYPFKYTDTLRRERETGGKRGGRRTGEIMRESHRGESMKETILTDRGRQTCKE